MVALVTVQEMAAVEKEADAKGLTYAMMMENAGNALAQVILDEYGYLEENGALALVGSGNNGGDALVALAKLAAEGWKTTAYIVRPRLKKDPLVKRLAAAGGQIYQGGEDAGYTRLAGLLETHAVLLDGVLGTGAKLPLKKEAAEVLDFARRFVESGESSLLVVAVDCPSGVDNDTGAAAPECIPADLTVTMAAVKQGLLAFPAFSLVGGIRVVSIGALEELNLTAWKKIKRFAADHDFVRSTLPKRPQDAHKGTFGAALVVAGSVNYTGAAYLAGRAAYLSGAGLVTLAVPAPLHLVLAGGFPEATWELLPHEMGVIAAKAAEVLESGLEKATSLLVGPGLGLEETTCQFLENLLGGQAFFASRRGLGFVHNTEEREQGNAAPVLPPLTVDADGLKLLARLSDWPARLPAESVLTPHPGEMSVLSGLAKEAIQADRIATAERFAAEWKVVLALKGAHTVVAAPDGRTAVIPVATAALARAGTGDVLAGLITGLRAQGVPAFEATVAAAWIHGQAGLAAAEDLGSTAAVLAGDVLEHVTEVLAGLEN